MLSKQRKILERGGSVGLIGASWKSEEQKRTGWLLMVMQILLLMVASAVDSCRLQFGSFEVLQTVFPFATSLVIVPIVIILTGHAEAVKFVISGFLVAVSVPVLKACVMGGNIDSVALNAHFQVAWWGPIAYLVSSLLGILGLYVMKFKYRSKASQVFACAILMLLVQFCDTFIFISLGAHRPVMAMGALFYGHLVYKTLFVVLFWWISGLFRLTGSKKPTSRCW